MTDRPTEYDEAILRIAATALAEELTKHDPVSFPESTRADVIDDLFAVLEDDPHADGFIMAKRLEDNHYWDCDFEIAEIMNAAWTDIDDALDDAVKAWITENNITPQFAKGDRVIVFQKRFGKRTRIDDHVYTVRKVYPDQAKYTLYCPELGHLSDEDYAAHKPGTGGTVILFENVEAAH